MLNSFHFQHTTIDRSQLLFRHYYLTSCRYSSHDLLSTMPTRLPLLLAGPSCCHPQPSLNITTAKYLTSYSQSAHDLLSTIPSRCPLSLAGPSSSCNPQPTLKLTYIAGCFFLMLPPTTITQTKLPPSSKLLSPFVRSCSMT